MLLGGTGSEILFEGLTKFTHRISKFSVVITTRDEDRRVLYKELSCVNALMARIDRCGTKRGAKNSLLLPLIFLVNTV